MKRCPECRRDYTDETLNFCLEDGAWLVDSTISDEQHTAILHETAPPGEAATRAQLFSTDQTAVFLSDVVEIPRPKTFDSRLLLAPLALAATVLVGFLDIDISVPRAVHK
ncbi:MAG: hypothetical protein ACJ72Z_06555 [Pyrinomonadaceae bacterium]